MSSGVQCHDEVKEFYTRLSLRHEFTYIVYKIGEKDEGKGAKPKTCVMVDDDAEGRGCGEASKYGDNTEQALEDIRTYMAAVGEPRYILLEVKYTDPERGAQDKVILIKWNLDDFKIKQKMVYAATASALCQTLGIAKPFQVSSLEDFCYAELVKFVKQNK